MTRNMCNITAALESDQLEEVYKEASGFGAADSIKEIWRKERRQNEFYSDQKKNSM